MRSRNTRKYRKSIMGEVSLLSIRIARRTADGTPDVFTFQKVYNKKFKSRRWLKKVVHRYRRRYGLYQKHHYHYPSIRKAPEKVYKYYLFEEPDRVYFIQEQNDSNAVEIGKGIGLRDFRFERLYLPLDMGGQLTNDIDEYAKIYSNKETHIIYKDMKPQIINK